MQPIGAKGELLEFRYRRCGDKIINFKNRVGEKCMIHSRSLQYSKIIYKNFRIKENRSGQQANFWRVNAKNDSGVSLMWVQCGSLYDSAWIRWEKNNYEVDLRKRSGGEHDKVWKMLGFAAEFVGLGKPAWWPSQTEGVNRRRLIVFD